MAVAMQMNEAASVAHAVPRAQEESVRGTSHKQRGLFETCPDEWRQPPRIGERAQINFVVPAILANERDESTAARLFFFLRPADRSQVSGQARLQIEQILPLHVSSTRDAFLFLFDLSPIRAACECARADTRATRTIAPPGKGPIARAIRAATGDAESPANRWRRSSRARNRGCGSSPSPSSISPPTVPRLLASGVAQAGQPLRDLLLRSVQQHRAADGDHVAVAQDPQMRVVAVDLGAVGAVEIGKHDLVLIFLDLEMEAADTLVGELDVVPFLAADRDRSGDVVVQPPAVGAVQDANRRQGPWARQECSGSVARPRNRCSLPAQGRTPRATVGESLPGCTLRRPWRKKT